MKIYKHVVSIMTIVGLTLALASGAQASQGFYVGGAFGKSYLDETIGGNRIDTDASSYRVYGGYGFARRGRHIAAWRKILRDGAAWIFLSRW